MNRALHNIGKISKGVAILGTIFLVAASLFTLADISLRSVSTATVVGVVDIVQLCVITGTMLAIPYCFASDQHISVNIVTQHFHVKVQRALMVFASALAIFVLCCVLWFSFQQMLIESAYGDKSQTIGVSMTWYWYPFLFGLACSIFVNVATIIGLLVGAHPLIDGSGARAE